MWFTHLRHKFVCKNPDVSIDLKKKAVFRKSREIACPANGKGWTRKQRRIDEWLFAQVVPISPRFRVTPYDTPGVLFIPPALRLPRYVRLPSLSVCGHDRTVGPTRLEMVVVFLKTSLYFLYLIDSLAHNSFVLKRCLRANGWWVYAVSCIDIASSMGKLSSPTNVSFLPYTYHCLSRPITYVVGVIYLHHLEPEMMLKETCLCCHLILITVTWAGVIVTRWGNWASPSPC